MTTIKTIINQVKKAANEAVYRHDESQQVIQREATRLHNIEAKGVYAEGEIERQRKERQAQIREIAVDLYDRAYEEVQASEKLIEQFKSEQGPTSEDVARAASNVSIAAASGYTDDQLRRLYSKFYSRPAMRQALSEVLEIRAAGLEDSEEETFKSRVKQIEKDQKSTLSESDRDLETARDDVHTLKLFLEPARVFGMAAVHGLTHPREGRNLTAEGQVSKNRPAVEEIAQREAPKAESIADRVEVLNQPRAS